MKNIYKMKKGQFVTIWLFGFFFWIYSIEESYYNDFYSLMSFLVPFVLIFYSIGWKHENGVNFIDTYQKIKSFDIKIKSFVKKYKRIVYSLVAIGLVFVFVLPNLFSKLDNGYNKTSSAKYTKSPESQKSTPEFVGWNSATTTSDFLVSDFLVNDLGSILNNDFGYSSYSSEKTEGRFVKVDFTIENQDNYRQYFKISNVNLLIKYEDGIKEFNAEKMFTCENSLKEYGGSAQGNRISDSYSPITLKPSIPCRIVLLYEIPKEQGFFLLEMRYRYGKNRYEL